MHRVKRSALSLALLCFLCLLSRLYIAQKETLWSDELFSLSMATGHSIWQRADQTVPALGDFFDPETAQPAAFYTKFTALDPRLKMPDNILRACMLVDYNSPLYYLMLWLWFHIAGISDLALRLPSILISTATLPLIWLIASRLGGWQAAWISAFIFAFSPFSLYYATEGRVYAFTIFFCAALLYLTLSVRKKDGTISNARCALWSVTAGLGLLANMLFIAVLAPALLWLACWQRVGLKRLALMAAGAAGIALIWDVRLPQILAIKTQSTEDYSGLQPLWFELSRPVAYILAFFSGLGTEALSPDELPAKFLALFPLAMLPAVVPISKSERANTWFARAWSTIFCLSGSIDLFLYGLTRPQGIDQTYTAAVLLVCLSATFAAWLLIGKIKVTQADNRIALLYLTIASTVLLPVVLDLAKQMHFSYVYRYAIPALPSAIVLAGLALSRLRPRWKMTLCAILILTWLPLWHYYSASPSRHFEDYKAIDARLALAKPTDVVIVHHTYPASVLGVARYAGGSWSMASWSDRTGVKRIPQDLISLINGKTGVYFVKVRAADLNHSSPAEDWLRRNATLKDQWQFPSQILYFVPKEGATFAL